MNTAEKTPEHTDLIPIEHVNAVELFTGGKLEDLLKQIEAEVQDAPTDTSTDRARKEIASMAYKVTRSKTVIDDAGKALVAEWKAKSAEVDTSRRQAREFLDALKERVRQPLTEWEAEQARIEEEKRMAAAAETQRIEEEKEAALRERERQIAEREAELERFRQEQERVKREAIAAAEREKREEQIARDAAAKASFEASETLKREQEARAKAEREAKEAEERREREAKEAAERAEREQIEATVRAARQAELAVEQERLRAVREAEERERLRRAEEEQKRHEAEARAADKAHRELVNDQIIAAFLAEDIDVMTAKNVIYLVAAGSIPNMKISY